MRQQYRHASGPRPPWWPASESWPPAGGWHGHRPRRGFGCLFGLFFLVVLSALVVVGSVVIGALGALAGGPLPGILQVAALIVLVVAIAVIVGVGRVFRGTAGTLDELVGAARRVESGDYSARVAQPRLGPPPVRELVRGFNTMAERLETDERQRRSLLADVSHELRTPLAVLQGNLEALLDGVHPPDEARLASLLEETRLLSRLVDDLRTLALAEGGTLPLHREPSDLGILAADVAESFRPTAEAGDVSLLVEVDNEVPLLDVDPLRLREVLANLLANALRYTPSGGSISVAASVERDERDQVRVEVRDSGAGIAADVLPHVFDRFWKSNDSRGSGLGLAIARNLVVAHGGEIGAASQPGAGTTIWFRLPASRVE